MTYRLADADACDIPRDRPLTRDELRVWLDRQSPKPTPVDERDWEEFELVRSETKGGAT